MCFKGISEVTSAGEGSSGEETSKYNHQAHACTDGDSS